MVTAQDVFGYMAGIFKKDEALKLKQRVVLQYNILGDGGGTYHIVLENGAYTLNPGDSPEEADCTMGFDSAETFMALHTGDLGPIKAYTSGKVKFSGSRKLIQEVGKIFPLGKKK